MKIIKVYGEDEWEGLYIDDKLVVEGDSLSNNDIFSALKLKVKHIEVKQDWLEDEGGLPKNLKDLPKSVIKRED